MTEKEALQILAAELNRLTTSDDGELWEAIYIAIKAIKKIIAEQQEV